MASKKAEEEDNINHPAHYASSDNSIECIDAIRGALGREGLIAFLRGQIIKYTWRADKKEDALADMKKCLWYNTLLINILEEIEE